MPARNYLTDLEIDSKPDIHCVFECFIRAHALYTFIDNNPLPDKQYGFCFVKAGHVLHNPLVSCMIGCYIWITYTCLFLDFRKAFDAALHRRRIQISKVMEWEEM